MKVELNYKDNRVILTLNDVGAVFADDILEGDLCQRSVENKNHQCRIGGGLMQMAVGFARIRMVVVIALLQNII